MTIQMAVIKLVCVAEKAVITSSRTALIPARQLAAGQLIEMEKCKGSPRQSWKSSWLLDQSLPDADPPLGGFPENSASLPLFADPLHCDLLLFNLVFDLNSPAQRVG